MRAKKLTVTLFGVNRLSATLMQGQKDIKKFGASATSVGSSITRGLSAPIAALGVLTLKTASDFEAAMKNTMTMASGTEEAMAQMESGMSESALALSQKLGISATAVADSFYQVLSTGAQALTPEFDALAETSLKMAKTVGLEPAEAIENLSDTLSALKMDVAEADRVADIFFKTSGLVATTVPQLTEAMREAGPTAATMGISLEETSAILAGFAKGGNKGARAGTAFRTVMTRLTAPTGEAVKALKFLGVSAFDEAGAMRPMIGVLKDLQAGMAGLTDEQKAAALKALAGDEAFAKLSSLLQLNMDTVEGWKKGLEESGGALDEAFGKKMAGAKAQMELFRASAEAAQITFGEKSGLLETFASMTKWLTMLSQKFAALSPATMQWVAIGGGIFTVLGPGVIAVGLLAKGVAALVPIFLFGSAKIATALTFAFGPVGLAIAAVALLGYGAYKLIKNWDAVGDFFSGLWSDLTGGFLEFADVLPDFLKTRLGFDGAIASAPAVAAAGAASGQQNVGVGGLLRVELAEGLRTKSVRSDNPDVPFDVTMGPMMAY